ncbi:hypothetical protein [Actinomycetospora sp. CA-084318]|uniref:hypothetical protein n=1 Tax=Actinomycetospora sp. CA-084318 TaxID=3239892 RepID=UPI003D956B35
MPEAETWEIVNAPATTMNLDCSSACTRHSSSVSPIDALIEDVRSTLVLGQPEDLSSNESLGRLLILSLVTSVEGYFRELLFQLTRVCPIAADKIADDEIPLGALSFYGTHDAARGLFERVSFSSAGEIRRQTKAVAGVSWKESDSLGVAIENFDKVCHMRHAAVHSKGLLSRGNARALGVQDAGRVQLSIKVSHLQDAASVCLSLVREYNQTVYRATIGRWRDQQILCGDWKKDKENFEAVYRLFRSREDGIGPDRPYIVYRSLQESLRRRALARA